MKRRARDGYTLLEIMVSVVVMTIGASGILAMQGASVRSNQNASETSVAINWATTWMERVKRDARMWTAMGNPSSTQYMSQITATSVPTWLVPTTTAPESAAADYFGFDVPITNTFPNATPYYCVNLRFTPAHVIGGQLDAIRADVLVWWKRTNANDLTVSSATCANALTAAQAAGAADVTLRRHVLSSVVTWRTPTVWP